MPTVKIKGNQLTLPDDLRQALTSAEDDLIDAEEVEQGGSSPALAGRPPQCSITANPRSAAQCA
jgi:hypothetical protein